MSHQQTELRSSCDFYIKALQCAQGPLQRNGWGLRARVLTCRTRESDKTGSCAICSPSRPSAVLRTQISSQRPRPQNPEPKEVGPRSLHLEGSPSDSEGGLHLGCEPGDRITLRLPGIQWGRGGPPSGYAQPSRTSRPWLVSLRSPKHLLAPIAGCAGSGPTPLGGLQAELGGRLGRWEQLAPETHVHKTSNYCLSEIQTHLGLFSLAKSVTCSQATSFKVNFGDPSHSPNFGPTERNQVLVTALSTPTSGRKDPWGGVPVGPPPESDSDRLLQPQLPDEQRFPQRLRNLRFSGRDRTRLVLSERESVPPR